MEYNQEQLKELILCRKDPVYFIEKYIKIETFTSAEPQPTKLHQYQKDLIRSIEENPHNLILAARQMGKSFIGASYLLWYSMFKPDKCILVCAPTQRISLSIMDMIAKFYQQLPEFIRLKIIFSNKGSIHFENGSYILGRPISHCVARGMAISLIWIDEFAFVKDSLSKEFWYNIQPTISHHAKVVIMSSYNDKSGQFYDLVQEHTANPELSHWKYHCIPAYKNPERDHYWAANELKSLGEKEFNRKYLCKIED